ncbi:MAG: aspartate-semialdehyde dehydrogenase [Spirochaetes bacterium]|jgi:aspartate-semialdehyde dehydrogenase|nr:aspartate-semialdehyde dehydrogenase [Spirochaetota bacterium]
METIDVAVLGATGTVGQKFITLLEGHPYFRVRELVASGQSAGKPYAEACKWKQDRPIPESVAAMVVKSTHQPLESPILFSGLDSSVAGEAETAYAERGHLVVSNSKNHRMDPTVPLVVPEINPEHLALIEQQPFEGAIVTNPNCSTIFLVMALAPLHRVFGLEAVQVTTMQAISGAGYPGVSGMDIMGNVIPYISGEEEKVEEESLKILGELDGSMVRHAELGVSATCTRVPVLDGHTETVSFKLSRPAEIEEVRAALDDFKGLPQQRGLPSAPERPLLMLDAPDRPQPARDIWLEDGMATVIGRLRQCPVLDYRMVVLGHNTVRGAAGASILNAETLVSEGYLANGKLNSLHRAGRREESVSSCCT